MTDQLRFVTPADPLFAGASALRYEVLHRPLGLASDADWDDADPHSRHLVAVRGETVVGYARLVMTDRAARIRHLAVDPTARHGGVGAKLMQELITQARREGRTLIWVNARFTALGFYRGLGFHEAGGLTAAEDTQMPHKRMELRL
ncbi:MAG TPA: GNAT family N-acetyltransferase [Coriobacteriia bacterium]|jgi:phosphoribosylformimino-5-aminoimidazole carboxamide ribotide isomerase